MNCRPALAFACHRIAAVYKWVRIYYLIIAMEGTHSSVRDSYASDTFTQILLPNNFAWEWRVSQERVKSCNRVASVIETAHVADDWLHNVKITRRGSRFDVGHLRQEGDANRLSTGRKRAGVERQSIWFALQHRRSLLSCLVVRAIETLPAKIASSFHVASNRVWKMCFNLPLRAVICLNFISVAILN